VMLTDLEERCLTFLRNGSGLNERMLIRQQLIRDLEAKRDAGEGRNQKEQSNERNAQFANNGILSGG